MKPITLIFCLMSVCLWGTVMCDKKNVPDNGQDNPDNNKDSSFFPIAVWLQEPQDAMEYKKYGINMYIGIWGDLNQTKLDQLKSAGIKVIASMNEFGKNNLEEPIIYAWMHGDEPDNAQYNPITKTYDPCIEPSLIIDEYNQLKLTDPSRPVYLNLGRGVAFTNWIGRGICTGKTDMYEMSKDGYLKGCDIASFDIYPVNSGEEEVKDNLWYVAKGIDNLRKWSDDSKPIWCWIETTQINKDNRKPTPDEVKSEVWMALIHGASGIGYFCHSFVEPTDAAAFLHDKEMISEVKKINIQITELAPLLNSPNINDYASIDSSNPNVPIDFLSKKMENTHYIFAISMRPGNSTATITIKEGKKVEVIGEDREIKIENKMFTDQFSGYSVHLYKITNL